MGPIEVTRDNYTLVVALTKDPVLVCCAPKNTAKGKRVYDFANRLGHKLGDDVLVATIDMSRERALAEGLGAKDVPMAVLVRDGYVIKRSESVGTYQALGQFAEKTIKELDQAAETRNKVEQAKKAHHWWHRK